MYNQVELFGCVRNIIRYTPNINFNRQDNDEPVDGIGHPMLKKKQSNTRGLPSNMGKNEDMT